MRHARAAHPVREAFLARRRGPPPSRGHRPRAPPARTRTSTGRWRRPTRTSCACIPRSREAIPGEPAPAARAPASTPAQWRRLAALRATLRARTLGLRDRHAGTHQERARRAASPARPRSASMRRARASASPRASTTCASRCRAGSTRCERNRQLVGERVRLRAARRRPTTDSSRRPPPPPWAPARAATWCCCTPRAARPSAGPRSAGSRSRAALAGDGMRRGLPGGTEAERAAAARLAAAMPGAIAAPAHRARRGRGAARPCARGVVGVDTGLTHLAVALGRPDRRESTARPTRRSPGLHGGTRAVNLGGAGTRPGRGGRGRGARPGVAPRHDARSPTRSPGSPHAVRRCCASRGARAASAATSTTWASASGATRRSPRRPRIWVHAVSVGETRAAVPLVEALARALSGATASCSRT